MGAMDRFQKRARGQRPCVGKHSDHRVRLHVRQQVYARDQQWLSSEY